MSKEKKRPDKRAKATQKLLNSSKLLAASKATANSNQEFESVQMTPRTNTTALKPRPDKKRG